MSKKGEYSTPKYGGSKSGYEKGRKDTIEEGGLVLAIFAGVIALFKLLK